MPLFDIPTINDIAGDSCVKAVVESLKICQKIPRVFGCFFVLRPFEKFSLALRHRQL